MPQQKSARFTNPWHGIINFFRRTGAEETSALKRELWAFGAVAMSFIVGFSLCTFSAADVSKTFGNDFDNWLGQLVHGLHLSFLLALALWLFCCRR